jgi:lipase
VHRFGDPGGAPLLALHGVTGHGGRYRPLATDGLPERRWIAVDLRGHGRSTWDAPWTAEQHVGDILDTLDTEGVARCDVVGHSFGGLLATHLAASAPDRVRRAVLLDPAIAQDGHDMLEAAEETRLDEGWTTREEAVAARTEGRPEQAARFAAADAEEVLEHGEDGRWRMPYCRSAVITAWSEMARPTVSLSAFPGELLLVPAMHDGMVGAHVVDALRANLGDRLTVQEMDAGHMVYWDAFDDTVDALRRFLGAGVGPTE